MLLHNITWREGKDKMSEEQVSVVPIGSTEQHGLHAPLGADSIIAEFLAQEAAREKDIICTPLIPIGVSDYHRGFWGTLWVSSETLKAYVGEVVRSLNFHGITKVILVNGHGGNINCLRELARRLKREDSIYAVVWTWFEAIQDEIIKIFGQPIPPLHADQVETSLLWAINGKLVREESLKSSSESASPVFGKYHNKVLVSEDVTDFSNSGATGNACMASSEKGEKLLHKAKSNLISLIEWLQKR